LCEPGVRFSRAGRIASGAVRLFGNTSHTAIHYVRTAHPERFTIDPTQA
jgi:hypothetical protein